MASNSKFCQPISVWKKYFTLWITEANPKDLLDLKIFFDFRFVSGDSELSFQLKNHINRLVKSSSNFFLYLSDSFIQSELPESILKLKGPVDLKLCLLPVIDFARLYGLKYNLNTSNTIERLEYIHEQGIISEPMFENILFSYSLLMNLRLRHQSDFYSQNYTINNSINPHSLTELQTLLFKKYLELLKEMKDRVSLDFQGTVIR
jgi:CBS domain-containing protein